MEPRIAMRGFSLTELAVTLSMLAIAAAAATPAFSRLLLDSRRDAAARTALQAIHVAKQLAAVRGETTRVCGSLDGAGCSGDGDWSGAVLVAGSDGVPRRILPLPLRGPRLRSNRAVLSFEAGSGFATPATITLCDRRGAVAARAVVVSRSGRPRVDAPGAGGSGISC